MTDNLITRRNALKFATVITLSAHGWHGVEGKAVSALARGYGTDPDLLKRTVTWPRTLNSSQLTMLQALCNVVLPAEPPHPAAGTLGVHEFVDEWVSAPYPQMQADRVLLLRGLRTLDDVMRKEHGVLFNEAKLSQQAAVFDQSCQSESSVGFAFRLIELVCAGYYTTREGHTAIGYVGNVALTSFPEPSAEIVRNFEQALGQLVGNDSIAFEGR